MRLKILKEDDVPNGHRAGDIFLVEDADYDDEKVVGVKVTVSAVSNAFAKQQMRGCSFLGLERLARTLMTEVGSEP